MNSVLKTIVKDLALLLVAGTMVGGSGLTGAAGPAWARAAQAQPAQTDPAQVVEHFHTVLLNAARKAGPTNYQARYDALDSAVRHAFDFGYISQAVLGAYWTKLTPEQRQTFTERFTRNTVATYAGQFDAYSGERFTFAREQTLQPNLRVVETEFATGDGEKHRFAYLLRKTDAGWRIANILVDNVSQMAVQRAEYTSILREHGFDTLIVRLENQTSRMKQTS